MDREREDRLVAREDRRGAVALVHVAVDDGDALQSRLRLQRARRDRRVVEDAEALAPVAEGVVVEQPLHDRLAVVEGAVDRERMDIVVGRRRHHDKRERACGNCRQIARSSAVTVSHPNLNMYLPGSVTRPALCHVTLLTTGRSPQPPCARKGSGRL